jgi:hypothetical protein
MLIVKCQPVFIVEYHLLWSYWLLECSPSFKPSALSKICKARAVKDTRTCRRHIFNVYYTGIGSFIELIHSVNSLWQICWARLVDVASIVPNLITAKLFCKFAKIIDFWVSRVFSGCFLILNVLKRYLFLIWNVWEDNILGLSAVIIEGL